MIHVVIFFAQQGIFISQSNPPWIYSIEVEVFLANSQEFSMLGWDICFFVIDLYSK